MGLRVAPRLSLSGLREGAQKECRLRILPFPPIYERISVSVALMTLQEEVSLGMRADLNRTVPVDSATMKI